MQGKTHFGVLKPSTRSFKVFMGIDEIYGMFRARTKGEEKEGSRSGAGQ